MHGIIKIRKKGSAGTHNGMKSVINSIGTEEFTRIRIGIGKPEYDQDMINYVIGKIPKEDEEILNEGVTKAVDSLNEILKNGIDRAMNKYN